VPSKIKPKIRINWHSRRPKS